MASHVIVLDFGAQYNQLIARRVREAEIFSEVLPGDTPAATIRDKGADAVILSGGPASVFEPGAPTMDPAVFELGIPVLGICYGMQLMAHLLGGRVIPAARQEYGRSRMTIQRMVPLLEGLSSPSTVWMSHGDIVESAPPGFQVLASTPTTPIAAMGDPARNLWAVQYHPEVHHTPEGQRLIENFLYRVAGLRPDWRPAEVIDQAVAQIRAEVGEGRALIALSGGVDSAVAGALAARAIGDRLTAVLIDHGLMRADEVDEIRSVFADQIDLHIVDASEQFFAALAGVTDPEAKRKIIGREFIRAFEATEQALGPREVLIQGTVYPDVIESGGGQARTIKSHHNVGGLPEDMRFRVVEPLRWLFKDEVRRIGTALGLPDRLVWRHPFPGPGLAVRIIGEVTREKVAIVRAADAIVRQEIDRAGLNRQVWQAFAVLLDIRAVGVMGDQRTYGYPLVVRAVESLDGMTADWVRLPPEVLDAIANRVVGEVPAVNRVVYDITSKPPGTIEWE